MNKELSPMEALQKLRQNNKDDTHLFDDELLNIIEDALKENAELKLMIRQFNKAIGEPQIIPPTIDRKLKVLEIIEEFFWLEDFQDFIALGGMLPKSFKEKYELLKEYFS